ncbi:MAG TPA: preprotein translocase subunit SecE [Terriglobia bacterium]|jgi:preprotein translocase subunit SecE|nr:preprotein translocase subunit SecE [Terriglobia bacterium]
MANELTMSKDWAGRLRNYVSDVRAEMKRVTWPGKQEVYGTTVMVIITTFLFGFYFMICDEVFSRLISFILKWGKSL